MMMGFNPYQLKRNVSEAPRFIKDLLAYRRQQPQSFSLNYSNLYPIMTDFNGEAGWSGGHYFHQDLWAARKILEAKPSVHVDIGSRIDGFVAHVLCFMPITVIDIRPLSSDIPELTFIQDDATLLSNFEDDSVESLSSLHAIEHFGLGRYGDPVDPEACFKAMASLARVLKPGGRLYFSVPIGVERVEFNAHRVFAPDTILKTFGGLKLLSFAAVDDDGHLHLEARPEDYSRARLACGLFEFTKG